MDARDFDFFTDGTVADTDEAQCSECGAWSPISEWAETEVYCEDCGSHPAARCPACEEAIDGVYARLPARRVTR